MHGLICNMNVAKQNRQVRIRTEANCTWARAKHSFARTAKSTPNRLENTLPLSKHCLPLFTSQETKHNKADPLWTRCLLALWCWITERIPVVCLLASGKWSARAVCVVGFEWKEKGVRDLLQVSFCFKDSVRKRKMGWKEEWKGVTRTDRINVLILKYDVNFKV